MSTLEERFWSKVAIRNNDNECWLWQGAISESKGYGRFRVGSEVNNAHRVAYELVKGKVPRGLMVLHSCDVPACCNPSHLRAGTAKDNSRDKLDRGRQPSKLTPDEVLAIRKLSENSGLYQREIANAFGISQGEVSQIVNRKLWVYL